MPTVAVDKEDLWDRLGRKYSDYLLFVLHTFYCEDCSMSCWYIQVRTSLTGSCSSSGLSLMKMYDLLQPCATSAISNRLLHRQPRR